MLVETNDLWTQFLDSIKNEISTVSYNAWFNDLKLIFVDNTSMTIQVPMEIHKRMLGDTYYSLIEDTLFKLNGINYDINFVLEEEVKDEDKVIEELPIEEEKSYG